MNWAVMKDLKIALGFSLSLIFGLAAVLLALYDSHYAVLFIIMAQVVTAVSVSRASKITHHENPQ
ncbi:hypothetical protein [Halobacillus halophilus]|uniref:hypothetical protein n=1 Tax=Halobacillus halophilus TaxID=1570 RepID=UPI001CD741C0|nr:hypothetical protein [Halobacillus halophilus]MCA1011603.1 hypothetical protein [Halobacillus halophilus]